MTNIQSKTEQKKVQSHIDENFQSNIDKAFQYLDKHLPSHYAIEVVSILKKRDIEIKPEKVRNIRHKKMNARLDVLNALLLIAKKNEREKQLLESLI